MEAEVGGVVRVCTVGRVCVLMHKHVGCALGSVLVRPHAAAGEGAVRQWRCSVFGDCEEECGWCGVGGSLAAGQRWFDVEEVVRMFVWGAVGPSLTAGLGGDFGACHPIFGGWVVW